MRMHVLGGNKNRTNPRYSNVATNHHVKWVCEIHFLFVNQHIYRRLTPPTVEQREFTGVGKAREPKQTRDFRIIVSDSTSQICVTICSKCCCVTICSKCCPAINVSTHSNHRCVVDANAISRTCDFFRQGAVDYRWYSR
jgi:hypothetical protein